MKRFLLALIATFIASNAGAQLYVAPGTAFYVPAGNAVAIDSLALMPAVAMDLNGLTIQKSSTAVTIGSNGQSMLRTYSFSSPVLFTGTAGIYYDTTSLNGNTAGMLQLYVDSSGTAPFVQDTGSTDDPIAQYVTFPYSTARNLTRLTLATPNNTLPLTLLAYTAQAAGSKVRLDWKTAAEIKCAYFEMQRATDGVHFEQLFTVLAKGTQIEGYDYTDYDEQPVMGQNYYRLVEYDGDGSIKYCGTRVVAFTQSKTNMLSLWPNPAATAVSVAVSNAAAEGSITISDAGGKTVLTQPVPDTRATIDVSRLAAGTYFLRYNSNSFSTTVKLSKL